MHKQQVLILIIPLIMVLLLLGLQQYFKKVGMPVWLEDFIPGDFLIKLANPGDWRDFASDVINCAHISSMIKPSLVQWNWVDCLWESSFSH